MTQILISQDCPNHQWLQSLDTLRTGAPQPPCWETQSQFGGVAMLMYNMVLLKWFLEMPNPLRKVQHLKSWPWGAGGVIFHFSHKHSIFLIYELEILKK